MNNLNRRLLVLSQYLTGCSFHWVVMLRFYELDVIKLRMQCPYLSPLLNVSPPVTSANS